jgi:hypothetical protein
LFTDLVSVQLTIAGITYAGMYSPMPLWSKVCFFPVLRFAVWPVNYTEALSSICRSEGSALAHLPLVSIFFIALPNLI